MKNPQKSVQSRSMLINVKDWLVKTLRYYLGTADEHTVYEAEGVGLLMGLHLLKNLNIKLTHPTMDVTIVLGYSTPPTHINSD